MKTYHRTGTQGLIAAVLLLALALSSHAWEPTAKEREAGLAKGDLTAYFTSLSQWLSQQVPASPDKITKGKLKALLRDRAFVDALAERQFISKVWDQPDLAGYAKADPKNLEFVEWVMANGPIMDDVMLTRTPTVMFARYDNSWSINAGVLDIWKKIYYAYPESRKGLYLRLAIATALRPPGSGTRGAGAATNPVDPLERYAHFQEAHQDGELMPSFDTLTTWEMTHVVSSHASEKDLAWGRETVNTVVPGFRDGERVGTLTSQMKYQGSQIPYNDMSCLLAGGGKCGPRSSFGVFINQAFGIPSIGVGQPAHAAVAYRDMNGNWQVSYGRGWGVSKLADRYNMSGGEFLDRVQERKRGTFAQVEHLRWLAGTLSDQAQVTAVMAVADALATDGRTLIDTAAFDSKPDERSALKSFETPKDVADQYVARMHGFVHPPETGDYTFSVAADDMADLFLSTDEDPENKVFIAHLREWAEPGNYKKFPTQTSQPVRLEGGKTYYIEAVHRENGGGDYLAVAWSGPGVDEGVIPGASLSPYPSGRKGKIFREIWNDGPGQVVASAKVADKPEAPIKVAPGVIHVEAEDYFHHGAMGGWGGPGIATENCYTGGKQVSFGAAVTAWVGYKIHVPKSGLYDLTARVAVINWGQRIYARSFGAMYPVKSAKASDVFRDQFEGLGPQLAIDNNLGTRWAMNFGKEQGWLELDLGEPRPISKIMIDERSLNQVSRFQVDYKVGDEWTKLFDGETLEDFKKEFPTVTAQYVRLSTFDTRSTTGGPSIWEFSVGDVFDGSGWINVGAEGSWAGQWQTTQPIDMNLVEGDQTIWLCIPSQRGLSLRWFELTPKSR